MGKLVIKFQGKAVREVDLKLGDMKIGRKGSCDIVLDDPAVSAEHALVKTVGLKSSVQDLGSTNGTFVENHRIKQHDLKNGETIVIGGHSLLYRDVANFDATAFGRQSPAAAPASAHEGKTTVLTPFAQLFGVEGKDKGKRLPLVKDLVVLDNPGKNPARISRSPHGYVLEASIGPGEPLVNGRPVPPGGQLLEKDDIVEIAGTKFQFFC
jgi:hypothetical protein